MTVSAAHARSRVADFFVSRAVSNTALFVVVVSAIASVVFLFLPQLGDRLFGPVFITAHVAAAAFVAGMFVHAVRADAAAASTEV